MIAMTIPVVKPVPLAACGDTEIRKLVIEGEPDLVTGIICQLAKMTAVLLVFPCDTQVAGWVGREVIYLEK